jgi:hypothetical protein
VHANGREINEPLKEELLFLPMFQVSANKSGALYFLS